jgi:hypothetical protein
MNKNGISSRQTSRSVQHGDLIQRNTPWVLELDIEECCSEEERRPGYFSGIRPEIGQA